jgi:hypothetical protein
MQTPEPDAGALLPGIAFLCAETSPIQLAQLLSRAQSGILTLAQGAVVAEEAGGLECDRAVLAHRLLAQPHPRRLDHQPWRLQCGIREALYYVVALSGNPNEVLAALMCMAELHAAPLIPVVDRSMLLTSLCRRGCDMGIRCCKALGGTQLETHDFMYLCETQTLCDYATGAHGRTPDEYAVIGEQSSLPLTSTPASASEIIA